MFSQLTVTFWKEDFPQRRSHLFASDCFNNMLVTCPEPWNRSLILRSFYCAPLFRRVWLVYCFCNISVIVSRSARGALPPEHPLHQTKRQGGAACHLSVCGGWSAGSWRRLGGRHDFIQFQGAWTWVQKNNIAIGGAPVAVAMNQYWTPDAAWLVSLQFNFRNAFSPLRFPTPQSSQSAIHSNSTVCLDYVTAVRKCCPVSSHHSTRWLKRNCTY